MFRIKLVERSRKEEAVVFLQKKSLFACVAYIYIL